MQGYRFLLAVHCCAAHGHRVLRVCSLLVRAPCSTADDPEAPETCREWSDGVLTACARKVAAAPLEQRSWIVCDGDIDPEWIEALNSVLDDNRLLTMPNGERVQFAANVNFIFECHSLAFASPATVSRCALPVQRQWLQIRYCPNECRTTVRRP